MRHTTICVGSLLLSSIALCAGQRVVNVKCEATTGDWEVEVHPSWSPNGAQRYLDLVRSGFFTNMPLFRAAKGFLVQFGISMDKEQNLRWQETIQDDPFPIGVQMGKGIMAYAGYGKNSRATQVWIGYEGAAGLGHSAWETPFAQVVHGMENVEAIYSGYGDNVDQGELHTRGLEYVRKEFPKLDFIHKCYIVRRRRMYQGGTPQDRATA